MLDVKIIYHNTIFILPFNNQRKLCLNNFKNKSLIISKEEKMLFYISQCLCLYKKRINDQLII
jgi:hypothetical protein